MTATAAPRSAMSLPPDAELAEKVFEVATINADASRAIIRTTGDLTRANCALLVSVLYAHLRAGRNDLRVDVSGSPVRDEASLRALVDVHRQVVDRGGLLVFDNAAPRLGAAIRSSGVLPTAR